MKLINKVWNFFFGYPFRMTLAPYVSSDHSNVTPMPKWYGVAYRDPRTVQFICYPYPVHFLVRSCKDVYWWWRCRQVSYWEDIEKTIRDFVLKESIIYNAINQAKAAYENGTIPKEKAEESLEFWRRNLREHYQVWHGTRDKIILSKINPVPSATETPDGPETA